MHDELTEEEHQHLMRAHRAAHMVWWECEVVFPWLLRSERTLCVFGDGFPLLEAERVGKDAWLVVHVDHGWMEGVMAEVVVMMSHIADAVERLADATTVKPRDLRIPERNDDGEAHDKG
jgi:hypothetical protein